jgi:hypothetical protein
MGVRARHLLQKHTGEMNPIDSNRNVPITRSKDGVIAKIEKFALEFYSEEDFI